MTQIEFFDKTALENVSACLTYAPERVIYVGDRVKTINKHIEKYSRVLSDRGCNIELIPKGYEKGSMESAVRVLTEIVETYDDCVFDITGGEEILNLALGIVYASHPEKNIQIHKLNLRNNMVYDCDKDGICVYHDCPVLSVEENIRIYGGDVVYGDINSDDTYIWDLNEDFLKDIDIIWNICKEDVRYWNTVIGTLGAIDSVGQVINEETLTTVAKINAAYAYLKRHKGNYVFAKDILDRLSKFGLITHFAEDDKEGTVTVSFKNGQVKKCLTKAGQALEMKMFVTLKKLRNKEGNLMYSDVVNGVNIDWDGEFHDEKTENIYDTENEIDVLAMHNVVPIFISCKNGKVSSEELYKLSTVAERFGGPYSKKVLIATSIPSTGENGKYLRQRAKDMNIEIIEETQDIDDTELAKRLSELWKSKNVTHF